DGADHEGLGQAGHADEQAVAAGEDRRQDLLDHLGLADDGPAQLVQHLVARLAELGQVLADAVGGHRWRYLGRAGRRAGRKGCVYSKGRVGRNKHGTGAAAHSPPEGGPSISTWSSRTQPTAPPASSIWCQATPLWSARVNSSRASTPPLRRGTLSWGG